ncbi:MAG: phosphoserine phosphatase SerB [Actinobacteria bacterium]|nr:phosphoserine phosphatase SerB [Actinomycetota bacterium]
MPTPAVLITLSGEDRPGVTAAVTACLARDVRRLVDVEQIVIRTRLTLALLCEPRTSFQSDVVREALQRILPGFTVDVSHAAQAHVSEARELFVVSLLARELAPEAMSEVARAIASVGGNIERIRRTADYPITALEFHVTVARGSASAAALRTGLLGSVQHHGIDIAVQRADLDRRGVRLVVLDVDSTLVQAEGIDLLAAEASVQAQVSDITAAAMRGELDYADSLKARVRLLAGLPLSAVHRVAQSIELSPGARTLIRTLRRCGDHVALVSGGFIELIEPHAQELGIHMLRANSLQARDGILTGEVMEPVLDRAGKAEALRAFADSVNVPLARTVAIGDGANDLDMLAAAGLGIAFNAKPVVRDAADATVSVPYLDAVLYLLGITREQIEDADEREGVVVQRPSVL